MGGILEKIKLSGLPYAGSTFAGERRWIHVLKVIICANVVDLHMMRLCSILLVYTCKQQAGKSVCT